MKSQKQIEKRYEHVKRMIDKNIKDDGSSRFYLYVGMSFALEWVLNEERRPLCIDEYD